MPFSNHMAARQLLPNVSRWVHRGLIESVPFLRESQLLQPVAHSSVKSSHYYLYSAFNNANCVKAALHQLDIKLGGFTSALQYLDGK